MLTVFPSIDLHRLRRPRSRLRHPEPLPCLRPWRKSHARAFGLDITDDTAILHLRALPSTDIPDGGVGAGRYKSHPNLGG